MLPAGQSSQLPRKCESVDAKSTKKYTDGQIGCDILAPVREYGPTPHGGIQRPVIAVND